MVTSVNLRNVTWMDGVQVAAQDLRLQSTAAHLTGASPSGTTGIAARPGVRYAPGSPMLVQAASGMNITVAAGFAYVQGTVSATAGMYEGCLDTTSTLTVTTSDPTNPRIDNVIVRFTDNGNNTSTGTVEITAGTPAVSPVAPPLPANSLLLATIAVGALAASITAGNIADSRVYTVASGGILPMKDVTGGIAGPAGLYGHDLSTGRLKVSDGGGNAVAPKIGAFAPVSNGPTTYTATSSSFGACNSVTITTDGVTEITCYASWLGFGMASSPVVGTNLALRFWLDGSATPFAATNNEWRYRQDSAQTNYSGGGSFTNWVTPPAGTHTIAIAAANLSGSGQISLNSLFLRVSPSYQ